MAHVKEKARAIEPLLLTKDIPNLPIVSDLNAKLKRARPMY